MFLSPISLLFFRDVEQHVTTSRDQAGPYTQPYSIRAILLSGYSYWLCFIIKTGSQSERGCFFMPFWYVGSKEKLVIKPFTECKFFSQSGYLIHYNISCANNPGFQPLACPLWDTAVGEPDDQRFPGHRFPNRLQKFYTTTPPTT